jgi:hypothetical protein
MTLIIPASHAQVIHSLSLAGDKEPMAVTFGIELVSTTPVALDRVALSLHNAFDTEMNKIPFSAYALEATEVRLGSASGAVAAVGQKVGRLVSRGTAAPLPQNSALLVHKRSSLPGRRARGRMYIPGVSESAVSVTGVIDAASVSFFATTLTAWLALIVADPDVERMVILHSLGVSAVIPPTPVVSLVPDPIIATMRKRLR